MRDYDAARHAESVRTRDWRWAAFPAPENLVRPIHPDGDERFRSTPRRKVANSPAIIDHMMSAGPLVINTGDTTPDYTGKTAGVYLNFAKPTDPVYTVSKDNGAKNLTVTTYLDAPYGAKVRIGDWMVPQGYPMNEYSDHKMHIIDVEARTITEIQYITESRRNPLIVWLASLFGQQTSFQCHGVKQYSMDLPSTDKKVQGSSAARIPLAESEIRFEDFKFNWPHMTTCATPKGMNGKWVAPATGSDGPSTHRDSVTLGQIMRLSEASFTRLYNDPACGPQTRFFLCCWYMYGIMAVDTGANTSFGAGLDQRWDQNDLRKGFAKVSFTDFEIWEA